MATPNLFSILSTTKCILNSNSRHFLSLSLLFLLPQCIFLLISPTLSLKNPLLPLILSLPILILSLLATGTLAYSTSEVFLGRQVSLSRSLKSLSLSFFRLLATVLAVQLLIFLLLAAFAIVFFILNLSFGTNYRSNRYYWAIFWALFTLFLSITIHFQVSWSLAYAVVVVESKWGFEPLRRSKYLIKGMRSTALSLLLLFGVITGFTLWVDSDPKLISFDDMSQCFYSFMRILGESFLVMVYMLYNYASNTVLYMYCKAEHGETSSEIAEEFVGGYVSIPIDDEKPPHAVYVAKPI